MSTDFEAALRHKYRLNGVALINVTGVTGLLDDDKSSKMAGAAAKITRAGADYKAEWAAKRDRGTRVHASCETWLRGEDAEVLDEDALYVDGLDAFFKEKNPYPIEIERIVLSELGYGGRFDFIAEFEGQITLVDVKTGRNYFIEHTLQLSAYRFADGMAVYGDDGSLVRLDPLPHIDRAGCLYLDGNGSYEFREYPADEDAFALFSHLLAVKRGITEMKESA